MKTINRKAFFDYNIGERFEAGIKLTGPEVKSIKEGHFSLNDSFVKIVNGEPLLLNCHINPYKFADNENYDPKRTRKLLLHGKEIISLQSKMRQGGFSVVPVALYTKKDLVKVELALARGKKQWDKRKALKEKSIQRDEEEEIRGK